MTKGNTLLMVGSCLLAVIYYLMLGVFKLDDIFLAILIICSIILVVSWSLYVMIPGRQR
jgi:hypothetical protein